jgi:hypothetical protein
VRALLRTTRSRADLFEAHLFDRDVLIPAERSAGASKREGPVRRPNLSSSEKEPRPAVKQTGAS